MSSPHWRGRLKSILEKVSSGLGFQRPRKVRFQPEANVFEFERQLGGGGGVPERDAMALGLGPKLVSSYSKPLAEKQGKDEYAATGYLDIHERTRLLSQWEKRRALEVKLQSEVGPELETLQRQRSETASSARDQRYMPMNQDEANAVAARDEEFAKKMMTFKPRRVGSSGRRGWGAHAAQPHAGPEVAMAPQPWPRERGRAAGGRPEKTRVQALPATSRRRVVRPPPCGTPRVTGRGVQHSARKTISSMLSARPSRHRSTRRSDDTPSETNLRRLQRPTAPRAWPRV